MDKDLRLTAGAISWAFKNDYALAVAAATEFAARNSLTPVIEDAGIYSDTLAFLPAIETSQFDLQPGEPIYRDGLGRLIAPLPPDVSRRHDC